MSTAPDLSDADWVKSSYSQANGGNCIEVAPVSPASSPSGTVKTPVALPGLPGVVLVGVHHQRPGRRVTSCRSPEAFTSGPGLFATVYAAALYFPGDDSAASQLNPDRV
ncbi:DUF397 domain-containing protein [Streptomyces sp. GS7]|uniref:DUF397 domain-containing protein n=1 Tax=Streptomyces sp. GS7 TaxID=2692234 RepID=UPI003FA6F3EF